MRTPTPLPKRLLWRCEQCQVLHDYRWFLEKDRMECGICGGRRFTLERV